MATQEERARSFGVLAERYERVRPSYPPAALDALLGPEVRRVLDVGAGTGKLTRLLLGRGLEVVAVEPDEKMAAVLAGRHAEVDVRAGVAEALPLADGEVEAVLFAQAWHWVDPERAGPEAARVLRDGGTLGLLWNTADDSVGWVARLSELTKSEARYSSFEVPGSIPGFCRGHRHDVRGSHRLSADELIELVLTWSAVSTLPDSDRQALVESVAELLGSDPGLAGVDVIDIPQVCIAVSYHRL